MVGDGGGWLVAEWPARAQSKDVEDCLDSVVDWVPQLSSLAINRWITAVIWSSCDFTMTQLSSTSWLMNRWLVNVMIKRQESMGMDGNGRMSVPVNSVRY